jgi:carbon monoxide dehydrogenase subunit G
MKLSDTYTFDADQDTVWRLLMDPAAIAKAMPGVDKLTPIDGETNAWRATAKIGIAAVNGTYSGMVRLSEITAPTQYRLSVNGEGQQSFIGGTALLTLHYDSDQKKTILDWDADANISGKLASIAQRLIVAAASMLGKQFFRGIASQLPNGDQS